jgi:hypothetical protein
LIGVEKGNSKRRKSLSNYKDNKRLLVAKHSVDKSSTKHSQITSDTETQEQQEQQDKKNI